MNMVMIDGPQIGNPVTNDWYSWVAAFFGDAVGGDGDQKSSGNLMGLTVGRSIYDWRWLLDFKCDWYYPLVNIQKDSDKPWFLMGKLTTKGNFQ